MRYPVGSKVKHFGLIGQIQSVKEGGYLVSFGGEPTWCYESEVTLVEEPNGDLARWEDEGGQ